MNDPIQRWARLLRRTGEILIREGPESLIARARRRLLADDRRIWDRYPSLAARQDAEAPPHRADPPLISVVTPVKDPPIEVLRATARSVLEQRTRVEWCVADDASRPPVREELQRLARDPRVRLVLLDSSRGIAGATNAALALARGDLVAFLDHDDELHRDALAWMLPAFDDPRVGAAYSDEDKLDARGRRHSPFLKPGFSSDFLLACNYVSHLFVARHPLVRELGGLRSELDGSQDYDLALRLEERARIAHVPRVLYHWRQLRGSVAERPDAKGWAYEAARRALARALERRGVEGRVELGPWVGSYRVVRPRPGAEVRFFIDPDLAPEAGALDELAAHAARPDVAIATPRVLSWDRRIESAGLVLGFGRRGIAGCPFRGRPEDDPGYFGLARATRDVSAAPAAAFAIERRKLEALGGLSRAVAPVHAAIDLALRARDAGLRTVYACEAVLRRRTTRSPRDLEPDAAVAAARRALGERLRVEPHISPHFVRGKERLELPTSG